MRALLERFSFNAVKFDSQLLVCMVIVWLLVLVCAILSIVSQSLTPKQRWFWILVVVCLPCVGLLFYLPFSLSKDSPARLYKGAHKK